MMNLIRLKENISNNGVLVFFFIAYFIIRVFIGVYVAENYTGFFLHNDGQDYREIAMFSAEGKGLSIKRQRWFEAPRDDKIVPASFRPLLLSYLSSFILMGNPSSLGRLGAFQAFLTTVLGFMIFMLSLKISNSKLAAWFSLILFTFHPLFLIYSFRFSTEIIFTLMLSFFVYCWLNFKNTNSFLKLGITVGLASIARSTAILILPISLPFIFFTYKVNKWRYIIIFLLAFFVTILPLTISNYYKLGEISFGSNFGGYNFWLGNNNINCEAYSSTGKNFLKKQDESWNKGIEIARNLPKNMKPKDQCDFWMELSFSEIKNMGLFTWTKLLFHKLIHFIKPWPIWASHSVFANLIVTSFTLLLYLFGIIGIILACLKVGCRITFPFIIIVLCGVISHTLVHLMMRHRVPFIDFTFIVFAGYALDYCIKNIAIKFRRV